MVATTGDSSVAMILMRITGRYCIPGMSVLPLVGNVLPFPPILRNANNVTFSNLRPIITGFANDLFEQFSKSFRVHLEQNEQGGSHKNADHGFVQHSSANGTAKLCRSHYSLTRQSKSLSGKFQGGESED